MDWVKRNLYFVIGSAVALVLMGLAGFYLYSGWTHKNEVFEKLSAQYAELKRLYDLNPNPGSDKVNNIKAARDQQDELRQFIRRAAKFFVPPPAIPSPEGTNRVTSEEFTSQLRRTVDQLQRDATSASVTLPPNYNFSFEAQKSLMRFAAGSLDPLSVQLGEIKAICDVLFASKINALDNMRRERVSNDDYKGPPSDYLDQKSVTNDLAVIVPYEVSFRCFSAELAGVLNGFHSAPYCLLVKTIDVGPASELGPADMISPEGFSPDFTSRYGIPSTLPSAEAPTMNPQLFQRRYGLEGAPPANPYTQRYSVGRYGAEGGMSPGMARRYGGDTTGEGRYGGRGMGLGGVQHRPLGGAQPGSVYGQPAPTPVYPTPGYPAQPGVAPFAMPGRAALQTILDEKPLRVTLLIHVVKLLPKETKR